MTQSQTLPISSVVNVTVNLTPTPSPTPNLSTLLVLGTSAVIDTVSRIMTFASLTAVGQYFGTTSEEYLAAQAWFAQSPTPRNILIGAWAKTATHGQLWCAPLSTANTLIAAWNAVTNGGFSVSIDGGAVVHLTGMNFSAAANLNAVAAIISAALTASGASCAYNANKNDFVITSTTTGTASSVSFLTAPTAGVDISGMMGGLVTSSGAYLAPGVAAESALQCVQLFDNLFGGQWYGLNIPSNTASDVMSVAAYIEADAIAHFYFDTSQDANCIVPGSTTDIMYTAMQALFTHSAIQYSSTSGSAVCSLASKILTTNWDGQNTTITLMFKQEPGITPENLSQTQAGAIFAKNGNVYAAYNDGTNNIVSGITPSGQYIDTVIGVDWLKLAIQNAVYNGLRSLPKVPQTDAGMHQIGTWISAVCDQAVTNGLAAPGVWTGPSFGQLVTGQTLSKGYYIYVPPISTQSQSQRQARVSVPIQVAVKLAGAVQDVNVIIDVNP